jgi:hypothetical protein
MEIRDFKPGDEAAILELFEIVFKKPMSTKYWYWRFQDNPAGKYLIKLMWENDQLVGHYAVSPVFMEINSEKVLTALSMSTMTHPDFGGRGIFKDLSLSLYDLLENDMDVKSIWGFPNGNSHYGFIKNLDWKDIAVVHTLTMNTNSLQPALAEPITIVEDFDMNHVNILQQTMSSFEVKVDRNLAYLKWRYTNNPSNKYTIFEYNYAGEKQFLVTKLYPSQTKESMQDVFIMEYGITNHAVLPTFVQHLKQYYNNTIENVAIWCNLHDAKHIQLEKMGFVLQGKQTFLSARYCNLKTNDIADYRNWFISFGDSDVY